MVNKPVFFISLEPTLARVSSTFEQALCLRLNSVANVLAMALLVMGRADGVVAAFIGVLVLGSMTASKDSK